MPTDEPEAGWVKRGKKTDPVWDKLYFNKQSMCTQLVTSLSFFVILIIFIPFNLISHSFIHFSPFDSIKIQNSLCVDYRSGGVTDQRPIDYGMFQRNDQSFPYQINDGSTELKMHPAHKIRDLFTADYQSHYYKQPSLKCDATSNYGKRSQRSNCALMIRPSASMTVSILGDYIQTALETRVLLMMQRRRTLVKSETVGNTFAGLSQKLI